MKNVTNHLRNYIKASEFWFSLWFKFFKRKDRLVSLVCKDDDLFITAYARSGNTYFSFLARWCYPQIKIKSHLHTVAAIKRALRLNVPVIVIIRNPTDVIISNLYMRNSQAFDQRLANREILEYLNYYSYVYHNRKKIAAILNFHKIRTNPILMIDTISSILNINAERVIGDYDKQMKEVEKRKQPETSSLPNIERKKYKEMYLDELKAQDGYLKLQELYNKVIAFAE